LNTFDYEVFINFKIDSAPPGANYSPLHNTQPISDKQHQLDPLNSHIANVTKIMAGMQMI